MTGSLQNKKTKNGNEYYYMVINTKPKPTWIATGLLVKGNKRLANEMLKEKIAEYERLDKLEVHVNNMSFADYLRSWVSRTEVRDTTRQNYESALRNHIIPYFEAKEIKLKDVRTSTLRAYYETLEGKLASKSIRNQQGILSKALKDAFFDDLIESNPHDKIKLIKVKHAEISTLTMDEYKTFMEATKDHPLHLAIVLLCETAIRRGELLGLEYKNINLRSGEIHICATRTKVSKEKVVYLTKTDSSDRTMFCSDYTVELIKKEKEKHKEYRKLFGNEYIENDLLIKHPNGKPYCDAVVTKIIGNLTEKYFGKRITPHKLRHTVASIMVDNQIPIYSISKYLGHSSVQTTERVYVHAKKDFNRKTMNMLRSCLAES
ncbi:MAG: site-specific integrase [Clostridia bacterium]|nr:site-specific integrase [Clostridia bacterium]